MRKKSWFQGSLGGLVLRVFLVQIFVSLALVMLIGPGASIGFVQVALSGWLVGRAYRKRFNKNLDGGLKYKICKYYFFILTVPIFVLSVLATIFALIMPSLLKANFSELGYYFMMYLFVLLPVALCLALLLYWSLGWSNVAGRKKK